LLGRADGGRRQHGDTVDGHAQDTRGQGPPTRRATRQQQHHQEEAKDERQRRQEIHPVVKNVCSELQSEQVPEEYTLRWSML